MSVTSTATWIGVSIWTPSTVEAGDDEAPRSSAWAAPTLAPEGDVGTMDSGGPPLRIGEGSSPLPDPRRGYGPPRHLAYIPVTGVQGLPCSTISLSGSRPHAALQVATCWAYSTPASHFGVRAGPFRRAGIMPLGRRRRFDRTRDKEGLAPRRIRLRPYDTPTPRGGTYAYTGQAAFTPGEPLLGPGQIDRPLRIF